MPLSQTQKTPKAGPHWGLVLALDRTIQKPFLWREWKSLDNSLANKDRLHPPTSLLQSLPTKASPSLPTSS